MEFSGPTLALKVVNYFFLTFGVLMGCIAHFDLKASTSMKSGRQNLISRPRKTLDEKFQKGGKVESDIAENTTLPTSLPIEQDKLSHDDVLHQSDFEDATDAFLLETIFVYFAVVTMMIITIDLLYVHTSGNNGLRKIDFLSHVVAVAFIFLAGALIVSAAHTWDGFLARLHDRESKRLTSVTPPPDVHNSGFIPGNNKNSRVDRIADQETRRESMQYHQKMASGFFCFVSCVMSALIAVMLFLQMRQKTESTVTTSPSRAGQGEDRPPGETGDVANPPASSPFAKPVAKV